MGVRTFEQEADTQPMRRAFRRGKGPGRGRRRKGRSRLRRIVAVVLALLLVALVLRMRGSEPLPEEIRGSPSWAQAHYGNPDREDFRQRYIVEIDFLGRPMFVHKGARRHFLRLERLFEARAPEYAAGVAEGEVDDWSYINRSVRGSDGKSSHAFGIAIDINALANPLGTEGDMPPAVIEQWKAEGGEWGGDWSRPDPMHFETHLTPEEIRERYHPDGSPRDWYLEELIG